MSYLGLYLPFPLPLQTARSPSFTFLGHLNLVSHFYELLVPLAVSVLDHRMRRLVGETAAPVLLVCAVLAEVGRADKAFESQADDFALVFAVGRVLAAKLMLKYAGPAFAFEFLLEYTDLLFYFIQGLSQMLFFEFLELALELSSCILYSFLQGRVLFAGPLVILEQKLLMNLDGFELRSQIVNLLGMQISNPCYLLLSLSQPLLELIHFLRFRWIFVKKVAEINIAIARILQVQNLNFQLAHKQLVIRLIVDRDFFFALVQITQMVILLSLNVQQLTEFLSELGVIQIMVAYQFVHLFAAKQEFNFYSLPIF